MHSIILNASVEKIGMLYMNVVSIRSSPTQVVEKVKAAYGELTEHDAHMDILREIDDTLHAISADKKKPSDDSKAHEKHEREGHISKDPACPA
eukprot:1726440-Amphidinium_carterae.1